MFQPLADPARLAALRRTALLDSPPTAAFDRLTRLATAILHAPVALVTLVDADRQVVVSSRGLPEPWASRSETPLTHAICRHTLESGAPLLIADARAHPLVEDSLAVPELGVVAYAGIPLVTADGHALGSVCVIDHVPRVWTREEIALLTDLAASVMTEIELRTTLAERARQAVEAERARTAVDRERARLREIFEQAPALIALLVGPQHAFEFANPTYKRVMGRDDAALIGRPVRAVFPELAEQGLFDHLDAVYRSGTLYAATETLVSLDRGGDGRHADAFFSFVYQPLRDAEGEVRGILVNGSEVTEQVEARRRGEDLAVVAETARAGLQQVIDVLPEGIIITDVTGRVSRANRAAEDLLGSAIVGHALGRTAQTLARQNLRRLDGTVYPAGELPLERSLERGEEVRGVQLLVRRVGDTRGDIPALLNSAPLRDAAEVVIGAVAVFQDITTIKNFERARDALLATVAHDLKNPLTAIQGLAELTQQQVQRQGTPSNERIAARQESIVTAATQMTTLLNELLDALQVEMGQSLALDLVPTDLVALLQRAVAHQHEIAGHPLRLKASVPDLVCSVDAARLERVIGNLMANAITYSPTGAVVVVHLARESLAASAWATLRVQDHGRGIPVEDLPHVFDRFRRGKNVGDTPGMGIGLASVRQIVEQHGGTVTVDSQEGAGSTFTVRLPLQ